VGRRRGGAGQGARALAYIEALLPDLEANGLLSGAAAKTVRERMRKAATLEETVDGGLEGEHGARSEIGSGFRGWTSPATIVMLSTRPSAAS
jgi:hypothetical protein